MYPCTPHTVYRDQWRRRLLSFSSPGSKARPNVALSMGNQSTAFPTAIERWRDNNVPYAHHRSIAHWRSHFWALYSLCVGVSTSSRGCNRKGLLGVPLKKGSFFPVIISRFPFLFRGGEGARITTFKDTEEKKGEECHSARHFGFERAEELTGCCSPFFSHRWSFTKSTETGKKKKEEEKSSFLRRSPIHSGVVG